MDFFDTIEKRYSVRGYTDEPVSKEDLDKILDAAALAPTGVNYQPFKVYVIDTNKNAESLKKVYPAEWFLQAPIVLCVAVNTKEAWTRKFDNKNIADIDGTIVMDHIILAATALGFGTCYIANFNPEEAEKLIDSHEYIPLLFTPLGHIDAEKRQQTKKTKEELTEYI